MKEGGTEDQVKRVVKLHSDEEWSKLEFKVYDILSLDAPLSKRVDFLKSMVYGEGVTVVETNECKSEEHMFQYLEERTKHGNNGIFLRLPFANYEYGISNSFLVVKVIDKLKYVNNVKVVNSATVKVKAISHAGLICEQ